MTFAAPALSYEDAKLVEAILDDFVKRHQYYDEGRCSCCGADTLLLDEKHRDDRPQGTCCDVLRAIELKRRIADGEQTPHELRNGMAPEKV